VNKKISAQLDHLTDHGIDSIAYSICADDEGQSDKDDIKFIRIPGIEHPGGIIGKIKREYRVTQALKHLISSLDDRDVIYSRMLYPSLPLSMILRQPRACKIVIEYQTIEPLEFRLIGQYWYLAIDFLFGSAIRTYTDAIIGVTDEITEYQVRRSGDGRKFHITIGNGFDVFSAPVRQLPRYPENDIHLLSIASVSRWHGLDRLLHGLAIHRGPPGIVLHIAGGGPELPRLQRLAGELGIGDRVIFHGFTTGKALDALFDQCHIAVGTLGIHRKGLTQTSELKAREYAARGIPYIIAVSDPDFPPDFPYILRLPADETPVDMDQVIAFAMNVSADPDHPQRMRRYAEEHLDWSVKMRRLRDFLETLSGENTGGIS